MGWKTYLGTFLASGVLVQGCGDGNSPTSSSAPSTTDTRTVKADPSFANDIQEIFDRRGCSNATCHGAVRAGANLDLQAAVSYANLVNVASTSEPGTRVIPGNADASYLVIKLEGRQSVGSSMPIGGAALDETDLTNIKNWINRGAQNH